MYMTSQDRYIVALLQQGGWDREEAIRTLRYWEARGDQQLLPRAEAIARNLK